MIITYGISQTGKSHLVRNIECQDFHRIEQLQNGWIVAAVADGVGSASNSAIGARVAVNTVVDFCKLFMPFDYNTEAIIAMLKTAYYHAMKMIIKESVKNDKPIASYDTTLHTVIYDGHRVIYGHSGDGGIIGLTTFGDYIAITEPQKDQDCVAVMPLRAGYSHWQFSEYNEDLVSVILVTDGMLETICNYLLKKENKHQVYLPLGSFFADPNGFDESDSSIDEAKKEIMDFVIAENDYDPDRFYHRLEKIYSKHISDAKEVKTIIENLKHNGFPVGMMQKEQDDKTIVCLINKEMALDNKEPAFYAEVDWKSLQDALDRKLYPYLYESELSERDESIPVPGSNTEPQESDPIEAQLVQCDNDQVDSQDSNDNHQNQENDLQPSTDNDDSSEDKSKRQKDGQEKPVEDFGTPLHLLKPPIEKKKPTSLPEAFRNLLHANRDHGGSRVKGKER